MDVAVERMRQPAEAALMLRPGLLLGRLAFGLVLLRARRARGAAPAATPRAAAQADIAGRRAAHALATLAEAD